MASLCERGEAFITCHCDLFAPWTGFKRGPTNFIGVNLATFSRTLYGMEPLTLHFSFEISKERERECVCVCARGREEEEVFSSRPSMRIIHGVRGWGGKRRKWKIEKLVSQVRWSRRWSSALIFFMEDVKSVCSMCLRELKERKRYRVYFYWSSVTKGYVSQIPKYNGSHGKYLNIIYTREFISIRENLNEMYMEYRLQMEHFSSPIKNHFKNAKSKVSIFWSEKYFPRIDDRALKFEYFAI